MRHFLPDSLALSASQANETIVKPKFSARPIVKAILAGVISLMPVACTHPGSSVKPVPLSANKNEPETNVAKPSERCSFARSIKIPSGIDIDKQPIGDIVSAEAKKIPGWVNKINQDIPLGPSDIQDLILLIKKYNKNIDEKYLLKILTPSDKTQLFCLLHQAMGVQVVVLNLYILSQLSLRKKILQEPETQENNNRFFKCEFAIAKASRTRNALGNYRQALLRHATGRKQ